jgi:hypothetical protein
MRRALRDARQHTKNKNYSVSWRWTLGYTRANVCVQRTRRSAADGAWGVAERLPAPVNDPAVDEWSPAVAASGNLYFGAERLGTRGGSDLWVARLVDGVYREPENLGDGVNTSAHEVEPWIAPDESYLIFSALRRADGKGGYDLYLSRRIGDRWGKAEPLPAGINTSDSDWNQSVSPDGTWLYFSSNRDATGGNGKGDIYRVPMAALGL